MYTFDIGVKISSIEMKALQYNMSSLDFQDLQK